MKSATKTSCSLSKQLARQLAADEHGTEREATDRDARREEQYAKERERRSDVVGKIFKRSNHVDGTVHVGVIVSRVGSDHVLVRLLDNVTGVPLVDGLVLVNLDALCIDFGERRVSVAFYDDAVSYVAAHRPHFNKDQTTLPAKSSGSNNHAPSTEH